MMLFFIWYILHCQRVYELLRCQSWFKLGLQLEFCTFHLYFRMNRGSKTIRITLSWLVNLAGNPHVHNQCG